MKKIIICSILLTMFSLCVISLSSCGKNKNYSQVTLSTNPEITVIVNKDNVVVSVKGENDEGKLVVQNEELEGKKIDAVIDLIIKTEVDTGFLVKGNVEVGSNKVSVQVSSDSSQVQSKLESKVVASVEASCEKYDVDETIEKVKALTKEELAKLASKYDAFMTEVEANAKSYDELLMEIAEYHKEVAGLASVQLEKLYLDAKTYEFTLAKQEEVIATIDKLDGTYQKVKDDYQALINSLKQAITSLEEVRYNVLVDPNCDYQKCLTAYYQAKDTLNAKKAELAQMDDNDIGKTILQATVTAGELTLQTAKAALDITEVAGNASIDTCQTIIAGVIAQMETLQANLPGEIKTSLSNAVNFTDEKLNEIKTTFFTEFEKTYAEDIAKVKANIENRKASEKAEITK